MKTEYQSILDSCTESKDGNTTADDFALIQVLMQPALRTKFDAKINFQDSQETGHIILVSMFPDKRQNPRPWLLVYHGK